VIHAHGATDIPSPSWFAMVPNKYCLLARRALGEGRGNLPRDRSLRALRSGTARARGAYR
jgi:hypothetical protein